MSNTTLFLISGLFSFLLFIINMSDSDENSKNTSRKFSKILISLLIFLVSIILFISEDKSGEKIESNTNQTLTSVKFLRDTILPEFEARIINMNSYMLDIEVNAINSNELVTKTSDELITLRKKINKEFERTNRRHRLDLMYKLFLNDYQSEFNKLHKLLHEHNFSKRHFKNDHEAEVIMTKISTAEYFIRNSYDILNKYILEFINMKESSQYHELVSNLKYFMETHEKVFSPESGCAMVKLMESNEKKASCHIPINFHNLEIQNNQLVSVFINSFEKG